MRRLLVSLVFAAQLLGCASWQGARLYQRGSEALQRGDAARAVALLERASERVPHASEIQNHLGLAYAASGRPVEALAAFRRAVELDCDNAAAVSNLEHAEAALRGPEPGV
jgi:Flp pilus assembly protein TadD